MPAHAKCGKGLVLMVKAETPVSANTATPIDDREILLARYDAVLRAKPVARKAQKRNDE
jgi:hypothetical protein